MRTPPISKTSVGRAKVPVPDGPLKNIGVAASEHAKKIVGLSQSCVAIWGDNRQVLAALPPDSVHCTITSPPYGDQKNYGSPDEIGSGNADYEGYKADLSAILGQLYRITVAGGAVWLVLDTLKRNGHSIPLPLEAIALAKECGWVFQECVIWDKGKSLPWSHPGHFRGVFEYVLLLSKGKLRRFDLDSVRDADHLSSYWVRYPERFNPLGKAPTDLWHIPIPVQGSWGKDDLRHLCPFPGDLVRRMIALTSSPGDVILDPFAGTGIVAAMASAMGRSGVGIELNGRYFNAFTRTGYARIVREATHRTHSGDDDPGSLSELITKLRMLKYSKTLFTQISRPDRLGERARSAIAGFVVDADELSTDTVERPSVYIEVLAATASAVPLLRPAISRAISVAPLSKFGLDAQVEVLSPKEWKAETFHPERRKVVWYEYRAGRFNSYARELTPAAFLSALASDQPKATRMPPIFSRIGVKVPVAIPD